MADLTEDILYDIFSRIPIKSLARFRCVCKQWREYINEYINDPHLSYIHPHVKEERKLLHNDPINSSKTPFYRSKEKSSKPYFHPVSVLSLLHITMEDTTAGLIQVKKDLSPGFIFQVNTSSTYHDPTKIQGYCNGLIALIQEESLNDIGTTFVVINPLTKECHELPRLKRPNDETIIGQGLGFDNSTNTFKMVCVLLKIQLFTGALFIRSVLVHVLGTDSWREISQVPFYSIRGEAVYAHGRLYWPTYPEYSGPHLVWFDMKKEEFGVIDLPKQTDQGFYFSCIVDLNGEVGCVYRRPDDEEVVVVWVLKHDDQWIIHCVFDEIKSGSSYRLLVLGCWNQDGDLLMWSYEKLKFVYRLKSGSFHKLIGPGDEAGEGKAQVRMYQSSLLSIRKWH